MLLIASTLIVGRAAACLDDQVDGHAIQDVLAAQSVRIFQDFAGENQTKLILGRVKFGGHLVLELKYTKTCMSTMIPTARPTVPINNNHYFHLKIVLLCDILNSREGRTDTTFKNSDHYRP